MTYAPPRPSVNRSRRRTRGRALTEAARLDLAAWSDKLRRSRPSRSRRTSTGSAATPCARSTTRAWRGTASPDHRAVRVEGPAGPHRGLGSGTTTLESGIGAARGRAAAPAWMTVRGGRRSRRGARGASSASAGPGGPLSSTPRRSHRRARARLPSASLGNHPKPRLGPSGVSAEATQRPCSCASRTSAQSPEQTRRMVRTGVMRPEVLG